MAYYKPEVDYEPHDFTSSVFSVNSPDLDAAAILDGLDTIEVEFDEDRWTTQMTADGSTIHVHNPSRTGTIKVTFLDASAASGTLSTLARSNSPVTVSFTDQNAPDLNCGSKQARVQKHAVIKRGSEVDTPEWVFICTFLKCEAGGYRLQTVE